MSFYITCLQHYLLSSSQASLLHQDLRTRSCSCECWSPVITLLLFVSTLQSNDAAARIWSDGQPLKSLQSQLGAEILKGVLEHLARAVVAKELEDCIKKEEASYPAALHAFWASRNLNCVSLYIAIRDIISCNMILLSHKIQQTWRRSNCGELMPRKFPRYCLPIVNP